jgi:hypothetical protein
MRKTAVALLRCLALVVLVLVLVVTALPAALGHLLTATSLPIAEWARDEFSRQRRLLTKR